MFRRRYLLAVFLVVAATLAWWSGDLIETPDRQAVPDVPDRQVDYFFEDFRMISLDRSGNRSHSLTGKRLEHYQDDGTASLVEPIIEFVPPDAPSWRVESESGWLSADRSVVRLEGAVTMVRTLHKDAPAMRIDTHDLTINTDTRHAQTREAVRVTSPGLRVDAVGMSTHFDLGLLSLLSEVRGTYVNQQP